MCRALFPIVFFGACASSQQATVESEVLRNTREAAPTEFDEAAVLKVLAHYSQSVDFDFRLRVAGAESQGLGYLRKEGLRLNFQVPTDRIRAGVTTGRLVIISDGRFVDVDFDAMAYSAGVLESFPLLLAFANSEKLRALLLAGEKAGENNALVRIPTQRTEVLLSSDYWIDMMRVNGSELWLTRRSTVVSLSSGLFETPSVVPGFKLKREPPSVPIVP